MHLRHRILLPGLLALAGTALCAQAPATASTTVTLPPPGSILPAGFGAWHAVATPQETPGPEPAMSLVNANKGALEECGPQRSETAIYVNGERRLRVEAVQFNDYSGAWSAFTLLRPRGVREGKELGSSDAVGGSPSAILFMSGDVLAVAYPATDADIAALKPLEAALPKVHGSQAQPPLLPAFVPAKALVAGSVRYALGASTYVAEGGVLPAAGLGWDKSAEAITAEYKDRRGDETLTLLLYPTPQIAQAHLKSVQAMLPGLGPKFASAVARRENELVILANGSFSPEQAQTFAGEIHMRQLAAHDLATTGQPEFHSEMRKTVSLLSNIMLLFGVLGSAAILLGLFLGGGRALVRVLQGKPAATEPEFLSLHLAPRNAAPHIDAESRS